MRTMQIAVTTTSIFMLAAALTTSPALAVRRIALGGSYSRATIKKDCEGAGAQYDEYKNGSYGCINVNNGNAVNCVKGKCTGTVVSSSMRPPRTFAGILHPPHAGNKYPGIGAEPTGPAGHGISGANNALFPKHMRYGSGGSFAEAPGNSRMLKCDMDKCKNKQR